MTVSFRSRRRGATTALRSLTIGWMRAAYAFVACRSAWNWPMPPAEFAAAVDIGGTFTDITLLDSTTGRQWRAKTPSTPAIRRRRSSPA